MSGLDLLVAGLLSYVMTIGALLVVLVMWIRRPPSRLERGGLVLGTSWVLVTVPLVDYLAQTQGWWAYPSLVPRVLAIPFPLLIAWVVIWGVAAPMAGRSTWVTVIGLGAIDLVLLPQIEPIVRLGSRWLIGEAVALLVIAAPAVALARSQAVAERNTIGARLLGQGAMFTLALFIVVPSVASQRFVLAMPSPWLLGVVVGAFGLVALPGAIALVEFGLHGATPWPWDRTDRPIRSGPYRYLRSPMQLSGTLVLAVGSVVHGSIPVAISAAISMVWNVWFSMRERVALAERWGDSWTTMALSQRKWLPSWRPHPAGETARVWIDLGCDSCSDLARFVSARSVVGLQVRDARDHPEPLHRVRYERADGAKFDGVVAVGAVLEHVHLGWAMLGWFIRLPVINAGVRFVGDAVGLGPRLAGSLAASPDGNC